MKKSYSDLINLTGISGLGLWVDPKIIVALVELEEVKEENKVKYPKRTRIDIMDGDKTIFGAYIVKQEAVYVNTQMENIEARNQMKAASQELTDA